MQRLALLFCLVPALALAGPPERVVSINLCTDQLAMLLADPGQLVSVTSVARDPVASALAARATDYPANNGQAEAVLGFAPDLVLAGEWTAPATLAMLRRLGVRVETFPLENDFADIRANLTRMGDLLGVPDRAAGLIAAMDATLAGPAPAGPARGRSSTMPTATRQEAARWPMRCSRPPACAISRPSRVLSGSRRCRSNGSCSTRRIC